MSAQRRSIRGSNIQATRTAIDRLHQAGTMPATGVTCSTMNRHLRGKVECLKDRTPSKKLIYIYRRDRKENGKVLDGCSTFQRRKHTG